MNLEKSKTLQCLVNAYAGESQARNKYLMFAKVAKKEEQEFISNVFLETADNELEHAKLFYKLIPNGEYLVNSTYPFFFSKNTYENLISSSKAEKEEWQTVYKDAAIIAQNEGFNEISDLFNHIIDIEKRHYHRYEMLAQELKNSTLYKKEELTQWICLKCGHTHIGKEPPCSCPVCKHPFGYFKLYKENI